MPELLRIKTNDWELSLWCNDIATRQDTYLKTLLRHNKLPPISSIIFSNKINAEVFNPLTNTNFSVVDSNSINLEKSLFFENTLYQLELVFFDKTLKDAFVRHKLTQINNSFRFTPPRNEHDLPRLIGGISTGNNIGWMQLPIYFKDLTGKQSSLSISFHIAPTKMDMEADLISMYKDIDNTYPLWRFNLATKTEQSVSTGSKSGYFPILWLAHFEGLRQQMLSGLKVITSNPHSQLQNKSLHVKAEKLIGKLSHKQMELLVENKKQGYLNRNYEFNKKYLSLDTPENRFIKKIVGITKKRLSDFHRKLECINFNLGNQQLSAHFINQIKNWHDDFSNIESKTFLNEIPNKIVSGIATTVLQQKTGYNTVFKVWQVLKFYLDMFDSQASISMKSVSEIYELWCFLELREILITNLHFEETSANINRLTPKDLELKMKDGFGGAFEFERSDGTKIRLAHEPIFTKDSNPIRTFWSTQKPDILMEVTLPNKNKYIWIFDAKYRIDSDSQKNPSAETTDYVPEDAINQMHRYRDALVNISNLEASKSKKTLSRSVFGAFALYPGFFNQEASSNPYSYSIKNVGVGAFALLPKSDYPSGNNWLREYLQEQIGPPLESTNLDYKNEEIILQSPSRISLSGTSQNLYENLILVSITQPDPRDENNTFISDDNDSNFYKISTNKFRDDSHKYIIPELKFLAPAQIDPGNKSIEAIWPIKSATLHDDNREKITESYWLLELGTRLMLKNPIRNISSESKSKKIKFTTLGLLEGIVNYDEIPEVYINRLI